MIFINYAREDYEHAIRLFESLKSDGLDPWLDKYSILPGTNWEHEIHQAIIRCDYFVALLSNNSIAKRGYVQNEIKKGLDVLQTVPFNQIFLIPARLNPCEPQHPMLLQLQWVDFFPFWDQGYEKLFRVFSFAQDFEKFPDLSESQWKVKDSDGEQWIFYLRQNGIVVSVREVHHRDIVQENGKWRIMGNKVFMEFNNNYVQYSGAFDNWILHGKAQNIDGKEWTWRAEIYH